MRNATTELRTAAAARSRSRALTPAVVLVCVLTASAAGAGPVAPPCAGTGDSVVAWWPGDGNAVDIVGDNDGDLGSGTTFVDGAVGQAFQFTTTNADVMVPASAELDVGAGPGFTVELWVNPVSNATRDPLIEWNRQSGDPTWGVHLWVATSNQDPNPRPGNVYANIIDTAGGSHIVLSAEGHMVAGEFQHVALTYDKASGVATIYRNGTSIATETLGTFTPQTSYDLFFASRPGPAEPTSFDGRLDEVALHDRALSAKEIGDIFEAGASGKCLCGDGISDRSIKAGDALFVLQSAVGTRSCDLCVCDVNGSGSVTASDSLLTLKIAVGQPLEATCPACSAE